MYGGDFVGDMDGLEMGCDRAFGGWMEGAVGYVEVVRWVKT